MELRDQRHRRQNDEGRSENGAAGTSDIDGIKPNGRMSGSE